MPPQPPDPRPLPIPPHLAASGLLDGLAAGMRLATWQIHLAGRAAPHTPADWDPATRARAAAFDGAWTWLAARLAGHLAPGHDWLYIHGPYGAGKTHLAAGLLYDLAIASGLDALLLNWAAAIETVKASISCPDPAADRLLAAARSTALLVLDDLDKTDGSRFIMTKAYAIIDGRLMAGLTTILTANRPIADLVTHWAATARPDERAQVADRSAAVAERLAAACTELRLDGPSFRLS